VDYSEAGEVLISMAMLASSGVAAARGAMPQALTEAARMISNAVAVEHMPLKYKLKALQVVCKLAQ